VYYEEQVSCDYDVDEWMMMTIMMDGMMMMLMDDADDI